MLAYPGAASCRLPLCFFKDAYQGSVLGLCLVIGETLVMAPSFTMFDMNGPRPLVQNLLDSGVHLGMQLGHVSNYR